jgi:hypothetical protein
MVYLYKIIIEELDDNHSDRKHYKEVCAPTMTVAVGLNSCVVLQPATDSTVVVSKIATLMLAMLL